MSKAFAYENRPDGTDVWLTPPYILDALGGSSSFDLDPCAAPEPRPWPTARRHITEAEDGLMQPWDGRVWLNPPYKGIEPWLNRMALHRTGTVLIFARTETAAWHKHIWPLATAMLFLKGRLVFLRRTGQGDSPAPAPSVLVAFGLRDAAILQASKLTGRFISL